MMNPFKFLRILEARLFYLEQTLGSDNTYEVPSDYRHPQGIVDRVRQLESVVKFLVQQNGNEVKSYD